MDFNGYNFIFVEWTFLFCILNRPPCRFPIKWGFEHFSFLDLLLSVAFTQPLSWFNTTTSFLNSSAAIRSYAKKCLPFAMMLLMVFLCCEKLWLHEHDWHYHIPDYLMSVFCQKRQLICKHICIHLQYEIRITTRHRGKWKNIRHLFQESIFLRALGHCLKQRGDKKEFNKQVAVIACFAYWWRRVLSFAQKPRRDSAGKEKRYGFIPNR